MEISDFRFGLQIEPAYQSEIHDLKSAINMIPSIEFGGAGPSLHFAAANGYPPGAYRPLIETLTPHYRVCSMLFRPLWPGIGGPNGLRDWSPFVDDLIRFLDEHGARDVIGLGHSLGSVATVLAALRRPDLFRAVVMIDPVIFPRGLLFLWTVLEKVGVGQHFHPFHSAALKRQRVFESANAAYEHYRRKTVFSRIGDEHLRLCAESLMRPRADGKVELAFPPEWEARIYAVGPLVDWQLWREIKNLRLPLLIVRGGEPEPGWPDVADKIQQRLPHTVIRTVAGGGHLVPLEKPDEVGKTIQEFLNTNVTN